MSALFDINGALKLADRLGDRAAVRAIRRYHARAIGMRRGAKKLEDDDVWQDFQASLARCMSLAYRSGKREWAENAAMSFSVDKTVRRGLRRVPKRQRRSIDKLYSKIAASATRSTRARVRDRMLRGVIDYVEGDAVGYSNRLKAFSQGQRAALNTVVLTQNSIAFNAAIWHESEDEDELWGFEYSTAGDERVRASHAELEGVRYPKDHPFWNRFAPPNGWRCRCTLNPIYRGDAEASVVPYTGTPDVPSEFKFNPGRVYQYIKQ